MPRLLKLPGIHGIPNFSLLLPKFPCPKTPENAPKPPKKKSKNHQKTKKTILKTPKNALKMQKNPQKMPPKMGRIPENSMKMRFIGIFPGFSSVWDGFGAGGRAPKMPQKCLENAPKMPPRNPGKMGKILEKSLKFQQDGIQWIFPDFP